MFISIQRRKNSIVLSYLQKPPAPLFRLDPPAAPNPSPPHSPPRRPLSPAPAPRHRLLSLFPSPSPASVTPSRRRSSCSPPPPPPPPASVGSRSGTGRVSEGEEAILARSATAWWSGSGRPARPLAALRVTSATPTTVCPSVVPLSLSPTLNTS